MTKIHFSLGNLSVNIRTSSSALQFVIYCITKYYFLKGVECSSWLFIHFIQRTSSYFHRMKCSLFIIQFPNGPYIANYDRLKIKKNRKRDDPSPRKTD